IIVILIGAAPRDAIGLLLGPFVVIIGKKPVAGAAQTRADRIEESLVVKFEVPLVRRSANETAKRPSSFALRCFLFNDKRFRQRPRGRERSGHESNLLVNGVVRVGFVLAAFTQFKADLVRAGFERAVAYAEKFAAKRLDDLIAARRFFMAFTEFIEERRHPDFFSRRRADNRGQVTLL